MSARPVVGPLRVTVIGAEVKPVAAAVNVDVAAVVPAVAVNVTLTPVCQLVALSVTDVGVQLIAVLPERVYDPQLVLGVDAGVDRNFFNRPGECFVRHLLKLGPGDGEYRIEFEDGERPTTGYLPGAWIVR